MDFSYCHQSLSSSVGTAEPHGSVTLSTDLPEEERTGIGLRLRLLYKLIAELPEMDRILISLELEDVRQAEIARITGLSEGNVRVRIHRIKALLTKKIRAYEE